MVNAIYCGLCIPQSADEAHHDPKVSQGKEGALLFALCAKKILEKPVEEAGRGDD